MTLEKNQDKINRPTFCRNPIKLLEKNQEKILWPILSSNPNAIEFIEKNQDKIRWMRVSNHLSASVIKEMKNISYMKPKLVNWFNTVCWRKQRSSKILFKIGSSPIIPNKIPGSGIKHWHRGIFQTHLVSCFTSCAALNIASSCNKEHNQLPVKINRLRSFLWKKSLLINC